MLQIKKILFTNFRNYEFFELPNIGSLTLIVGPNGAGKTNIIEGIQLLTSLISFRRALVEQLIFYNASQANLKAEIEGGKRELLLSLRLEKQAKSYSLNGKSKRASELKGVLPSVLFTPDDLNLVKGAMGSKRRALDELGSQLSSNHYLIKKDYEKVLRAKNKLLREEAPNVYIESINELLITCGAQLVCYRAALFEKIAPLICQNYAEISGSKEKLEAFFWPSWDKERQHVFYKTTRDKAREQIAEALEHYKEAEVQARKALIGPHADTIQFYLDGKDAGLFGSQGQQRSIVLAVKTAEVEIIEEMIGQCPVLLLDDVMGELDDFRRAALLKFIKKRAQTFITATSLSCFEKPLIDMSRVVQL